MLIRLQSELDDLANEMLDQIPSKYFKSTTATFLDPALGGGQFVAAVENRLREYGHSDENIAERVIGLSTMKWNVQIAKNRNGLVGHYEVADFLEDEIMLKPTVTLGNPPFQGTNKNHKLWVRFLKKAIEISDVVAFVSPAMASQMLNGLEVNQVTLPEDTNVLYYNGYDVDKHFNVSSSFCSYVVSKEYTPTMNVVVDGEIEQWSQESFIPLGSPDPMISSIISKTCSFTNEYGRTSARVSKAENGRGRFECIEKIVKDGPVWCTSADEHPNTYRYKMIYPTMGDGEYLDLEGCVMPTTSWVPYIPTDTKKELRELVKLQNSNVFKFLCQKGFPGLKSPRDWVWKNIRKGDFNLTKEEMEYIDSHVE